MNTIQVVRNARILLTRLFIVIQFAILFSLGGWTPCFATTVVLQWGQSTGATGYKVYYQADSSSQPFTGSGASQGSAPINVVNGTNATISGLDPAHSYNFAITAYNTSGESEYSNIVSVPELVSPTITLTSPPNYSNVSGTVTVTASASDNAGVTKVEFYVNGTLKTSDTSSPYVYSWNTSSLAPGSYTLMAKAYDAAGNEGQSSNITATVVNDTIAPIVSLTAPGNNSTVSGTVSMSASASDNVDVTKVEFYENGILLSATNVAPFNYNWNTTSVANGSYTLSAKAYDAAGNVGQSSNISVAVNNPDTSEPTVSLTTPANNATISGTLSVSATASDNIGVAKVEFYVNNVLQTTDTSAPYSSSWNTTSVTNGSYTLSAKAYDAAGNVGTSSNITVTVNNLDTTSPTVSISSPSNNASVNGTVSVTATASDNIGVAKVEFYVNGALKTTDTSSPYSFSWNTTSVANGSYTLSAKAYDAAGNIGTSSSVPVTVNNPDTISPTVSISSPSNNASVNGTVSVTATASDNIGVSKVEFYVNGSLQATDTTSPYSFSWNTTSVSNGTYTLTAKAYDATGNIGQSQNVTLIVNNSGSGSGTYTVIFGNAADATSPNTVDDTYINLNSSVNSTATSLNTYTWPANKPANAILMKWNISSLPANAQIQSATLSLYMTESGGDSLYTVPVSQVINKSPNIANCNGYTYDGTNAWDSSSITYNGVPLAQSDIASSVDAPQINTTAGYKNWNVTNMVKDWIANPTRNFGLLLNSPSNASSDSYRYFASSEVTALTQRPKLVVTYSLGTDTTAPTSSIISPINNATINGTQTITASASDNIGVSKVEFYVNSALQSSDTASPYTFSWNTTSVANGSYTLSAKAYDAAGNVSSSSNVTVNVSNTIITTPGAPTIGTATAGNAQATVYFTAPASNGGNAITSYTVTSSAGHTAIGNTSPITVTGLTNGTAYTFTVKATNSIGTGPASAASNTVIPAPASNPLSVSIISPISGATYNSRATVILTAAATTTANGTITKVEFYRDSTLMNSVTTSPYTYTWRRVSQGTYSITAKVYDSTGASKVSAPITVKVVSAASGVSFSSVSPASPRPSGTSVTFSASATGGSGSYEYQYLVKNPVTGWATTQSYSTNRTFIWNTSGLPSGFYSIQVMARNVGSSAHYEAWKTIKYSLK